MVGSQKLFSDLKIEQPIETPKQIPLIILQGLNTFKFKSTRTWIEDDIEFIKIDQYFDDNPPLLNLPFDTRLGISMILAASFLFGSFFKGVTYAFVFLVSNKHGWTQRPINALILTSAIIHHITHGWLVIWYILALMNETPLGDLFDPNLCHITQYVGIYGLVYLSVGSLGIAIFRALYIRHECWVKYVIGERFLLMIIWSLSIAICGVITVAFNIGESSQYFQINMCQGISGTHAQTIIDYQLHQGQKLLPTTYLQMGSISACLGCQTIEFGIYIWFFWHRYQNDNGNISKLLTEDVIRSRNMKNMGTFVGQFYGFIIEYSFMFSIFLLTTFADVKINHTKAMLNMIKTVDFGVLSAVEVLCSPSLRSVLWKILKGI